MEVVSFGDVNTTTVNSPSELGSCSDRGAASFLLARLILELKLHYWNWGGNNFAINRRTATEMAKLLVRFFVKKHKKASGSSTEYDPATLQSPGRSRTRNIFGAGRGSKSLNWILKCEALLFNTPLEHLQPSPDALHAIPG